MDSVQRFLQIATLACLIVTFCLTGGPGWVSSDPPAGRIVEVLGSAGGHRDGSKSRPAAGTKSSTTPAEFAEPLRKDVREVIRAFPELAGQPVERKSAKESPAAVTYSGRTYSEWRERLFREAHPDLRLEPVAAIATLGANGRGEAAARDLFEVLKTLPAGGTSDPQAALDAPLAAATVKGLQKIGAAGVPVLLEVLQAPEAPDSSRQTAAEILATSGQKARQWAPLLLQVLETGDHRTRQLARLALRGRSPCAPELVAALADELTSANPSACCSILDLLREMSSDSRPVAATILSQLAHADPKVREAAVRALESCGFFAACQAGELADYGVTSAAVHDLALMPGYRSALELADRNALREETVVTVLRLLGELGTPAQESASAIERLTAPMRTDPVRTAAQEALEQIRR